MSRLREDIAAKLLICPIVVYLLVYIPNYGKFTYYNMEVVTSEMLVDGGDYTGYPAGDGIVSVNSVEEMNNNDYFTIEVSKEDIVETEYYVKDIDGIEYYRIGPIRKYAGKIIKNMENQKFAQFCIITLPSGEKCIALIDTDVINVNASKTIKLPIGEKNQKAYRVFGELPSIEGVSSEGCNYFIDTTCYDYYSSPKLERLIVIKGWIAAFVYITTYVILTKINKKLGYETEIEMIRNLFKAEKES